MEDIQKLKRKRKMTGDQLGRALLGIVANDVMRQKDPSVPEYCDLDTIYTLSDKIKDPAELAKFGLYEDIYYSIIEATNRRVNAYNDSLWRIQFAYRTLNQIGTYHNSWGLAYNNPLVITRKDYDKITQEYRFKKDDVIREVLKGPGAEYKQEIFKDVLERAKNTMSDGKIGFTEQVINGKAYNEFTVDHDGGERNHELESIFLEGKRLKGESDEQALERINTERFQVMARHAWLKDISIDGVQYSEIDDVLEYSFKHWGIGYLTMPARNEVERKVREICGIPALPFKERHRKVRFNHEWEIVFGIYPDYYTKAITDYVEALAPDRDELTWDDLERGGLLQCRSLYAMPFIDKAKTVYRGIERLRNGLAIVDDMFLSRPLMYDTCDRPNIPSSPAAEVYRGMQFVYGYNAILDILADVYEVPELTVIKMDTKNIEELAESYNAYLVRMWAASPDKGMREMMRTRLEYLRLDQAKPDPDKVKSFREWFRENRYTRDAQNDVHCVTMMLDEIMRF